MTTSDGYIIGTTKIVDHGPPSARFNVVILGDGYRSSEMAKYHADVQNAIDIMYATAPFSELWLGINIFRVDVASTDSGVDDPANCGDQSTGSGASVKTYFDAKMCGDGQARRLLTVNDGTALSVAGAQVPAYHMVFVVVNTTLYGGSGGSVATFSVGSGIECAMHEMGHSAFGLADEYPYYFGCGIGEAGHDHYNGGEPNEPNVTIDTNIATNKWRDLISAATAMPTTTNANCSDCDTQSSPVPVGTIGTFEGARYFHCGVYRPEFDCKMRALGPPFCAVCERTIRQTLAPFQPVEYITLLTPSISFTDIPEGIGTTGVTAFRAIVFELVNNTPKTFSIVSGPTGGFDTPLGTSIVMPPPKTTPVNTARIWLAYTSTTAGTSSSGMVTVQCLETGEKWDINIVANTVARPKAAVVLVLDHSGSMIEDAGDNYTKVQKLREAASLFVNALLPNDSVGIVRFNHAADLLMPVTQAGPLVIGAGRNTAIAQISSPALDPNGNTSIGAGVVTSKQALDTAQASTVPHFDVLAQLVLTDGMENTPPFLSNVSSSITANTFAIGLGNPENISTTALNTLTQGHNGYLLITGTLTPDQAARLNKYFLQILAGITNANIVLDPHGYITSGMENRIPFKVTEADMGLDVFLLSPGAKIIDFKLEAPNKKLIDPSQAGGSMPIEYVAKNNFSFYRIGLPAIPKDPQGSHFGTWNIVLKMGPSKPSLTHVDNYLQAAMSHGVLPYDAIVHCYSNLNFKATVQQSSLAPDAIVRIFASLKEYDAPVEKRAKVWAEVTMPSGGQTVINLCENDPGQFQGSFNTTFIGLYSIRVRAMGETLSGNQFWREQTLTAVAKIGEDPTPDGRLVTEQRLCRLLKCLMESGAINPKLYDQLNEYGIDFKKATKCFEKYCAEVNPITEKNSKPKLQDLLKKASEEPT